ncbi:hypothetical protein GQ457_06G011040 [Hibiscus cannabinus]
MVRPFIVHKVYPHGAVDLNAPDYDVIFKVNGQRLKIYNGAPIIRDKGMSQEGFPPNVMATIPMHKWEKFVTHPGSADPQKKPINVTLVQEFYAHLTSLTQSTIFVRGEHVQFTAAKINKGLKGMSNDFLLVDLCTPGADWDSTNMVVERDRLNPEASLTRLQLLHSIINGRSIDVGKIIVDEAYACLTRKSNPLLFPHLIIALC